MQSMLKLSKRDLAFNLDPRRQQELRLRPYADEIYRRVFDAQAIERFDKPDNSVLDMHFAIDFKITMPNGLILNGQEKFLSAEYASYNSVTVEYEQDQSTGEQGDWFKIACQLYFTGYERQDGLGFGSWTILNWANVVMATNAGLINWRNNKNKNGRAKASFVWCPVDEFPESCVVVQQHCSQSAPKRFTGGALVSTWTPCR